MIFIVLVLCIVYLQRGSLAIQKTNVWTFIYHILIFGFALILGYVFAEGRPIREHRLPCCGMGIGWFL